MKLFFSTEVNMNRFFISALSFLSIFSNVKAFEIIVDLEDSPRQTISHPLLSLESMEYFPQHLPKKGEIFTPTPGDFSIQADVPVPIPHIIDPKSTDQLVRVCFSGMMDKKNNRLLLQDPLFIDLLNSDQSYILELKIRFDKAGSPLLTVGQGYSVATLERNTKLSNEDLQKIILSVYPHADPEN